jgi:hypothetical protein
MASSRVYFRDVGLEIAGTFEITIAFLTLETFELELLFQFGVDVRVAPSSTPHTVMRERPALLTQVAHQLVQHLHRVVRLLLVLGRLLLDRIVLRLEVLLLALSVAVRGLDVVVAREGGLAVVVVELRLDLDVGLDDHLLALDLARLGDVAVEHVVVVVALRQAVFVLDYVEYRVAELGEVVDEEGVGEVGEFGEGSGVAQETVVVVAVDLVAEVVVPREVDDAAQPPLVDRLHLSFLLRRPLLLPHAVLS